MLEVSLELTTLALQGHVGPLVFISLPYVYICSI